MIMNFSLSKFQSTSSVSMCNVRRENRTVCFCPVNRWPLKRLRKKNHIRWSLFAVICLIYFSPLCSHIQVLEFHIKGL